MIVGEDAVCWHSLSERLVLCLADFSVIDHSVVCSALKMKFTLKIRRYFNSKMGRHFSKVRGHGHIGPHETKKSGGPAPAPGSDAYGLLVVMVVEAAVFIQQYVGSVCVHNKYK